MSDTENASPDNMSRPGRLRRIVIVGRDEALWLTASTLSAALSRTGFEITAVELPSLVRPVDVVSTLPNHASFHSRLGLKEAPLMAVTHGTYSLGQRFANFAKTRPPFMHSYGSCGAPINLVPFHHYWVRARDQGLRAEFEDFSLNAAAARQGRFFRPEENKEKHNECGYAYHLSAGAYCQLLKQVALSRGIGHLQATGLDAVSRDPENGHITAVSLSNGQTASGDFFIDATGAESLLLGQALGTRFESWQQWFPCDRLLTASAPPFSPLPSFSQVSAFRSGWVGQFPLRNRTAIRQVYSSVEMDEEEALQSAAVVTSMPMGAASILKPYTAGRREVAWSGNCVGIGEAAAVFDPIDNVDVQAILMGLAHLTSMIPLDRDMAAECKEYNLNIISSFERTRDYQICHYKLNKRYDEPLWDHCRDMALPDLLHHKIKLFEARGHLVEYNDETFIDHDWHSIFLGHGLIPQAYDPKVDQTPESEIIPRFQNILGGIKKQIMWMRPMEAYFQK
ncbi:MAG: tryptophan 7-halogenase [Asticcacaulis sp.]|uniref:tryptophan halogenase family protein n=1 Tax=Asticcacaulis sp. TaxID=1872648 RepID=UPI0039E4B69D